MQRYLNPKLINIKKKIMEVIHETLEPYPIHYLCPIMIFIIAVIYQKISF